MFEVGKAYRSKDGKTHTIVDIQEGFTYPIATAAGDGFTAAGLFYDQSPSDKDLIPGAIEEVEDTMQEPATPVVEEAKPVPPQSPILKYFKYSHLPPHLQEISKLFHDLAHDLEKHIPGNAEKSVALRKLLEGKDAAVRACIE